MLIVFNNSQNMFGAEQVKVSLSSQTLSEAIFETAAVVKSKFDS